MFSDFSKEKIFLLHKTVGGGGIWRAPPPAPFLYGPAISVINAFSGLFFRKQGFSSERKVLILLLLVLFHLQNRLV